jgi:hypothetical protein
MKLLVLVLTSLLLVTGCDNGDVSKFVGTWHWSKYPNETLTIKDEGDGRISVTGKPWPTGIEIGQIKGDTAVFDAMSTATLKKDGTLVYAGREYVK